jgi:hypothetical protein
MSKVSTKHVRLVQRALLAAPLALGVAAVTLAEQGAPSQPAALTASPAPSGSSAPASTSRVTVNGKEVPMNADGLAHVSLPSSNTQVETSGGNTMVTTTTVKDGSPATNRNESNVNVNVNSSSNANTMGSTQESGFTANGNSTSFTSTNVFSAGSTYTHVSSP